MLFDETNLPDWNNVGVLGRNKLPGRAYFIHYPSAAAHRGNRRPDVSPMVCCLNGEWQFCYLHSAGLLREADIAGGAEPREGDGRAWRPMPVPSVWQLQGVERPFYVNVPFPFPATDPLVPFENPVGIYVRSFEFQPEQRAVLSFLGVSAAFHVYLNGRLVGYSEGSHNMAEFDVTDFVRAGENRICVFVYKWCNGSYLECQDMFRYNGIFRDVYLTKLPALSVADVRAEAAPRAGGFDWRAEVELAGEARGEVEIALLDGKRRVASFRVPAKKTVKVETFLPSVKLWSAETPNVYRLAVSVFEEGREADHVRILTGFRTVSTEGGVFRVNGVPVKCKGVNHHDTHPRKGFALSMSDLERDVRLMKQFNIDTVRFSHYPPHPAMLELCDEYGLYAVDEADIESHGELHMEEGPGHFADLPAFRPAFLDRVQRLYLRDRNHPCVILWSLGNESGFGKSHLACYRWLRARTDVPVHYEGARVWKGHWGMDVVSNMYPSIAAMKEMLGKYDVGKPYFLCEYAHCMGVGPGSLKEYWDLIYASDRCMGGCIWEFAEHCYFERGDFRYGGDGGEYLTDRDFCADGMFFADRRPKPAAYEVKNVYRPLRAHREGEKLVFVNTRSFRDTADLTVLAELTDGEATLRSQVLPVEAPPLGRWECPLPFDGRGARLLNLTYFEEGRVVGEEQFELEPACLAARLTAAAPVRAVCKESLLTVNAGEQELVFDLSNGCLTNWRAGGYEFLCQTPHNAGLNPYGPPARGFLTNLHRRNLSNDMYLRAEWEDKYYLHRLWHNVRQVAWEQCETCVRVRVREDLTPFKINTVCETCVEYEVSAAGVQVTASVRSDRKHLPFVPRFGLRAELNPGLTAARWFGRGPRENESDFLEAARLGWYECAVQDLLPPYSKPQEGGVRTGVERFALTDEGAGARFEVLALERPLAVSAYPFAAERFEEMAHRRDVRETGTLQLCVDGFRSGVGSHSCGHPPLDAYQFHLRPEWQTFRFAVRVSKGD